MNRTATTEPGFNTFYRNLLESTSSIQALALGLDEADPDDSHTTAIANELLSAASRNFSEEIRRKHPQVRSTDHPAWHGYPHIPMPEGYSHRLDDGPGFYPEGVTPPEQLIDEKRLYQLHWSGTFGRLGWQPDLSPSQLVHKLHEIDQEAVRLNLDRELIDTLPDQIKNQHLVPMLTNDHRYLIRTLDTRSNPNTQARYMLTVITSVLNREHLTKILEEIKQKYAKQLAKHEEEQENCSGDFCFYLKHHGFASTNGHARDGQAIELDLYTFAVTAEAKNLLRNVKQIIKRTDPQAVITINP